MATVWPCGSGGDSDSDSQDAILSVLKRGDGLSDESWDAVRTAVGSMDTEEARHQFCMFVTGAVRINRSRDITVKPMDSGQDPEALPTASTCACTLYVGAAVTPDGGQLEAKLALALTSSGNGFDIE